MLLHRLGLGTEHRPSLRLRLELRFEVDTKLNMQDGGGWQGILFSLDRVLRCLFLVSNTDVLLQRRVFGVCSPLEGRDRSPPPAPHS